MALTEIPSILSIIGILVAIFIGWKIFKKILYVAILAIALAVVLYLLGYITI